MKRQGKAPRPGNRGAEAHAGGQLDEHHQDTGSVACVRGCALACAIVPAWIADPGDAGIAWQLAWELHGLPVPLPHDAYGRTFEQVVELHGVDALVAGLRKAASIPSAHGSGVDPDRFAALADRDAAARRKGVAA